jgi:class 3 adenylate cyclase
MGPADARLFLTACAGFPLACLVHTASIGLFWYLGYDLLVLWEIGASLLWLGCWVLLLTGRALHFAFLGPVLTEIPIRAALVTYYTGFTTAFWLFILVPLVAIPIVGFLARRTRFILTGAMLVILGLVAALPTFVPPRLPMDPKWETFFLLSNVLSVAAIVCVVMYVFQTAVLHAEAALEREYDRAESLLKNILPDPIALRLKNGEHLIADDHAEVSVIFADIVDFTEASASLRPAELVGTLNLVFTEFDRLATWHGAEKIKTIGDAYMAVVGVPDEREGHAAIAVDLALDMLVAARRLGAETRFPIRLRIGVNSGPVVAGVIGTSKFAYDLWGDAVNVAARMESHGAPGTILVTEATRAALPDRFKVRPSGTRAVKGKGEMPVFEILAERDRDGAPHSALSTRSRQSI